MTSKQMDLGAATAILRGIVRHWNEFGPADGLGEMMHYAHEYLEGRGPPMEGEVHRGAEPDELAQTKAQLAEWHRWTQGHVWIRNEEYAELCKLKRQHGASPVETPADGSARAMRFTLAAVLAASGGEVRVRPEHVRDIGPLDDIEKELDPKSGDTIFRYRPAVKTSRDPAILDRKVTVCSECLCACCWQGAFYCDNYRTAKVVEKTVRELKALGPKESPDYWFKSPDSGKVDQQALEEYRAAVTRPDDARQAQYDELFLQVYGHPNSSLSHRERQTQAVLDAHHEVMRRMQQVSEGS